MNSKLKFVWLPAVISLLLGVAMLVVISYKSNEADKNDNQNVALTTILNRYHVIRVLEVYPQGYDWSFVPLDINGDYAEPFDYYLQVSDGVLMKIDDVRSIDFLYNAVSKSSHPAKWVDVKSLTVKSRLGHNTEIKASVFVPGDNYGFAINTDVIVSSFGE